MKSAVNIFAFFSLNPITTLCYISFVSSAAQKVILILRTFLCLHCLMQAELFLLHVTWTMQPVELYSLCLLCHRFQLAIHLQVPLLHFHQDKWHNAKSRFLNLHTIYFLLHVIIQRTERIIRIYYQDLLFCLTHCLQLKSLRNTKSKSMKNYRYTFHLELFKYGYLYIYMQIFLLLTQYYAYVNKYIKNLVFCYLGD